MVRTVMRTSDTEICTIVFVLKLAKCRQKLLLAYALQIFLSVAHDYDKIHPRPRPRQASIRQVADLLFESESKLCRVRPSEAVLR